MDRDLATKLVDTLADIKGDFDDIVTALETIATNTTPADDSEQSAGSRGEAKSGEEPEEQPEETRGGKK